MSDNDVNMDEETAQVVKEALATTDVTELPPPTSLETMKMEDTAAASSSSIVVPLETGIFPESTYHLPPAASSVVTASIDVPPTTKPPPLTTAPPPTAPYQMPIHLPQAAPPHVKPPPPLTAAIETGIDSATFQMPIDFPQAAAPPPPLTAQPTATTTTLTETPADTAPVVVTCTERDILMGRGKRVSEWPGNILFRNVVRQHRGEYITSARHKKVEIARQVIAVMEQTGGRFLKELDPTNNGVVLWSKWIPVESSRVIEKVCQALREKEKVRAPNGAIQKRSYASMVDGTNDAKDASVGHIAHRSKFLRKNADEAGDLQWQMLVRLEGFQTAHGHTAVPPKWTQDVALADWVSLQRQLFADLKSGSLVERKHEEAPTLDEAHQVKGEDSPAMPSDDQKPLIESNAVTVSQHQQHILDELLKMDFVVDYEEWHWRKSLVKLKTDGAAAYSSWLRNQQRNHREGVLTEDRRRQLEELGVEFTKV